VQKEVFSSLSRLERRDMPMNNNFVPKRIVQKPRFANRGTSHRRPQRLKERRPAEAFSHRQCFFGKLPEELRLEIYKLVVEEPRVIAVQQVDCPTHKHYSFDKQLLHQRGFRQHVARCVSTRSIRIKLYNSPNDRHSSCRSKIQQ
jgi:2EXR family